MQNYYNKSSKEVAEEFEVSLEKGLSQNQAEARIKKYGKNIIQKRNKLEPLKILIQQFNSFLIYILLAAAIVMFLIDELVDAVVISIIVFLNAGIGFVQQYKAEKAIQNLKQMIVPKSKVVRDGVVREISSYNLVPGDIVLLEQGDKINADCRIIEEDNLQTNEAILTGESLPVSKTTNVLSGDLELSKQKNLLFTGTQIVSGTAKAIVLSTGMNTVFGNIADTLQDIEIRETPMQKRLDKFSKQLGLLIIGIVILILLVGVAQSFPFFEMFLTAVALAISAIPEGLPAVLAIAFAISSVMLSKQNVIIRRLPAVETLGSVTVICSDKTGTITEEKMEIQEIFSNNKFYTKKSKSLFFGNKKVDINSSKELLTLIKTSVLCNNARFELVEGEYDFLGDPTENALIENALDLGLNKKILVETEPSVKKLEFDSERKMMSIARDNGRNITLYSKGAPEKILERCSFELVSGSVRNLNEKRKKEILEDSKKMEGDALRVLGFAYKNLSKKAKITEDSLIFLGLAGMIDPPRPEVKEAVKHCQDAGIKIKMITGDSAITATAIANQIGIKGKTVTEAELEKMSDADLLVNIDEIAIFARMTPQQKLRITKILQQKGEIVAITGDGVNDVLALKSADIGIAMGKRGTDISRDVSDIVLADDNFASIVQGVKQGRKTYDNIKKFAKYMLSVNLSEILLILFSIILASLFGHEIWYLPLLPLQILWMNLITDSFPALALALEKEESVLSSKPRNDDSLFNGIWKFITLAGTLILLAELVAYLSGVLAGLPVEETRTIVLTISVVFQLTFVYSCRSESFLLNKNFFSNKWLNYAVFFSLALHLFLIYTPMSRFFGVVPLNLNDWLLILPLALSGLFIFEGIKFFKQMKKRKP